MNRILIAGGTGFFGTHLINHLINEGFSLSVLSRKPMVSKTKLSYYHWNIKDGKIDLEAFKDVDTIINLTGANIGEKRWTAKQKKELFDSRIKSIHLLNQYVTANSFKINLFISASATGYYEKKQTDRIFSEDDNPSGDFLGQLCNQWENEARTFENLGARVIILRLGVIMGADGSFYRKFAPFTKLGINPAVGNGKQYISWIDIQDAVSLIHFTLVNQSLNGAYNAVTSQQLTMNQLAELFLKHFGKKKKLPNVPAYLIRLFYGEMASLLLEGNRISNRKIIQAGFVFKVNELEIALQNT